MTTKSKLPNKMSSLIRVALDDLKKVERDKKYVVDMGTWHDGNLGGSCYVCLAGSVMAKTLHCPIDQQHNPESTSVRNKLYAINYLREGDVLGAAMQLNLKGKKWNTVNQFYQPYILEYDTDPKTFHKQMRKLARDLDKVGL